MEKEYFWLHLNRSRVDEQAVRRKVYALVFERLVPVLLGAAFVVVVGLVLWATLGWQWISASLLGLGPVILAVVGFIRGRQVLAAPASGTFDRLVSTGFDVRDAAADGLKGSYQQLVESPDYRSRTGFFYLMHSDLERVLDLVATKERPLVILVDDLDRCSPSTVVQVIEAVNLFLAGQLSNCIFVLAMDPAVVATHIEIAYGTLAERLAEQARLAAPSGNLGWRFLEKIIQLPLTLPVMEQTRQESFYAHLFEAETTTSTIDQPGNEGEHIVTPPVDEPPEEEIARAARKLEDAPLAQMGAISAREAPGAAGREAARRIVDQRLTAQSPEVRAAIKLAGRHLNPNPREIKRFANVFRFLVMINDERGRSGLKSVDSLDRLAKIAVLTMRWPAVLGQLTDGGPRTAGAVLALLETPDAKDAGLSSASPDDGVNGHKDQPGDTLADQLKKHGLSDGIIHQLQDPELLAFVRDKPLVGTGYSGLV